MLLLNDEEWVTWSDREISRKCCVDHTFVGNLRKLSLATNTSDPTTKTYTNKHGQTATMNTENIGKRYSLGRENIGRAALVQVADAGGRDWYYTF